MGTRKVHCPLPERQEAWPTGTGGPRTLAGVAPGVSRNRRARAPLPAAVAPDRRAA